MYLGIGIALVGQGRPGEIVPSAPVNLTVPEIAGSPTVGETLAATSGLWTGSPSSYAYQWYADDVEISGATSSTYELTGAEEDADITVGVIATNGVGDSDEAFSAPVGPVEVVAGGAPVNSVLPSIIGTPEVGIPATVDVGTWSNSPTSYQYQWFLDPSDPLIGENDPTYTPTPEQEGRQLRVAVAGVNGAGVGVAVLSELSAAIEPPAIVVPTNTAVPEITGDAAVGQTLTRSTGTWTNSPSAFSTQWYADDVALGGEVGSTLLLGAGEEGAEITVGVVASNGAGDSAEAVSVAVGPVAGLFISPPELTLTSGTDNPPLFDREIPANAGEGDFLQRRIDTVDTYDSEDLREEERILLWDGTTFILGDPDTFEPSPFTIQATLPPGDFFISERFHRDLGDIDLYSDWSVDVEVTLAPPPETEATWYNTTGLNKNQYISITGSPLLVATPPNNFLNDPPSVRATSPRSGKRRWQITIGTWAPPGSNFFWMGVDDGTTDFDDGTYKRPGQDNSLGVSLSVNNFASGIWFNGSLWGGDYVAGNIQTGDIFICEFDTPAGTVAFFRVRSGTQIQIGTTVTGVDLGLYYANCGAEDDVAMTALFKTGQAGTPTSGFDPYDQTA